MRRKLSAQRPSGPGRVTALATALGTAVLPGMLLAQTTVFANRTGGFGSPNACSRPMIEGHVFPGPGRVEITATGSVQLASGGLNVPGPDGVSLAAGAFAGDLFPLEEAHADGGGTPPLAAADPSDHVGALIGAFVPEALAATPGFQAIDEDLTTVGIPSTRLFPIGAGPFTFTAPGPGRLFLGVNDTFACNNFGAFEVTVVPDGGASSDPP